MAAGDSETISAAWRRARLAFCSPSAAITYQDAKVERAEKSAERLAAAPVWTGMTYLGAGLSGGLGLGCHGPLQLHRQSDILAAREAHERGDTLVTAVIERHAAHHECVFLRRMVHTDLF